MPPSADDGPVDVTLVLEGGRVGTELGSMALLELGSALAAVTEIRGGMGDAPTPRWIGDAVPSTSGGGTETVVTAGVAFPSLTAARAAVRRCALTRMALAPVATGDPTMVATAMGPERAAKCAAQVLAPGRKGVPRVALERVGAELWDAGVGKDVAANRAWLIANATSEEKQFADESNPAIDPHVYLHPEGSMCEVIAWGIDSRAALKAVEAPNAMPPEQAFLALNAARVRPGDVVMDPCVGGGAVLLAALKLGAARVIGADVDAPSLVAAADAMQRDGHSCACALGHASLLDELWRGPIGADEAVDAIVTDLPYGVRSAAIGVGDGPDATVSPMDMFRSLLTLAEARLRRGGRIAAWLQRWDGEGGTAVSESDVSSTALTCGFWVERVGSETRKTGVSRALYVMVRIEDAGCCGKMSANDVDVVKVYPSSETFGAARHERERRALVMHAALRRNENYARVHGDGGVDVWRSAWVGDVSGLCAHLEGAEVDVCGHSVATAAEPAGAGNTPLAAAAGFGRVAVVAALLDRGACSGADVDAALVRAAEFGHLDTVVHLLARGADPACSRRDPEGKGPGGNALHAAAERGHSAVLETLLENAEASSLMVTDAYGRTAVEAAARWGHADAIRVCLRVSPGSLEINPTNLCLLAVRWGHEDALRVIVECTGTDGARAATCDAVVAEACRWSRGKIQSLLAGMRCETNPPEVVGARVVRWEPRTGAAALYCPDFWDPVSGAQALHTQVEGDYLPRTHSLVTPANRRGTRSPVPRDQAYYAASYRSSTPVTDQNPNEGVWWCSYRYNPTQTQQPAPTRPPVIIRQLSRAVFERSGQVCNHAVVNRYRDGCDSIGAHGDKALDLEDDSFIVSVSFGATRVMTFEPRVEAPLVGGDGGEGRVVSVADVKKAAKALALALDEDSEWREITAAKSAAAPRSEEKSAAVARERERAAALRESSPKVAAAAREARETRGAWKAAKRAASFELDLEPGSAVFFNMAFNARWTHAIHPAAGGGQREENEEEDEDGSDEDEDGSDEDVDECRTETFASDIGERVGVTLRRCDTVFDPVRQARAEGKPRGWRKGIWRPLREMNDTDEAERDWREAG
jgi:hypothetical protein